MPTDRDKAERPVAALIVAAGRGLRAGGAVPKQYHVLAGEPVLRRTLAPFLAEPAITQVLVVIGDGDAGHYAQATAGVVATKLATPAIGGTSRQESVRLGLAALVARQFNGIVLIHDAARPFISTGLIRRGIAAGAENLCSIPALPVTDTIKRVDAAGRVVDTPPRDGLIAVQTPQVFDVATLRAAHEAAAAAGRDGFPDDAALVEWAGHAVATFPGEAMNQKLTRPEDFAAAEARLEQKLTVRVATGYDVHAFGEGDHVWLGGVRIAHDRGVIAHSDGDVALHALTDALLGVLAEGDIGTHFPPSDPQWKGAASSQFLSFAAGRVKARGGVIDHLDISIVCEAPKIGPHRDAMRTAIATAASLRESQVAIKATTSERLGFIGRREGLAAFATVTIRLPDEE